MFDFIHFLNTSDAIKCFSLSRSQNQMSKINLHAFTPAAKSRLNHPVYMTEKEIILGFLLQIIPLGFG